MKSNLDISKLLISWKIDDLICTVCGVGPVDIIKT